MTVRLCLRLSPKTAEAITELATIKKITKAAVVEAAVASLIAPEDNEKRDIAFSRRLDKLNRYTERLERNQIVMSEALTLFIRSWFNLSQPIPPEALAAAQLKGRERYNNFIEALAKRLHQGKTLANEISQNMTSKSEDET